MSDIDALRVAIHQAVDDIFDRLGGGAGGSTSGGLPPPTSGWDGIIVRALSGTGPWPYTWPNGQQETYFETRWFEADGERGVRRVRLARAVRPAWGRRDRKRAVVFNQLGGVDSTTYYPWTEFVETDDGRYAAQIPDPERPRATLRDTSRLPGHLASHSVERTDALFESIVDGPSLRLAVEAGDEATMVRHGYWVAVLRNRI